MLLSKRVHIARSIVGVVLMITELSCDTLPAVDTVLDKGVTY